MTPSLSLPPKAAAISAVMLLGSTPIQHLLGHAGRRGKADAHVAAGARINGCIDADQIAANIHQRPTRVARVDSGISLDEVFEGVDAEFAASQGADNAAGNGLPDAKRISDGEHRITHLQTARIPQGD